MKPRVSNKLTIDYLCKLCQVDCIDKVQDDIAEFSETYGGVAFAEAIKEGKSEEEAEAYALDCEAKEAGEYIDRYKDTVVSVSQELFDHHGLSLHPTKKSNGWEFLVLPNVDWMDALRCIKHTMDGVGEWEFASTKELLQTSSCKNARECVLTHLHHMKRYYEVYGDRSCADRIRIGMRMR
jgi:hypothetical protein